MAKQPQEDYGSTMPPSDEELDQLSYFGNKNESIQYKDIVVRAIETCRKEGSREMSRGGQKMVYSKELNDWVTINIPDQKKLYQQSIMMLYDLMIYYFDEEAERKFKDINDRIKGAYKEILNQYILHETWEPYKIEAQQSGVIRTGSESQVGAYYNNAYEDYIFALYREMFQELLLLYKRKNELSKLRTLSYMD